MRPRGGRPGRALAALVALGLGVAACSSPGPDPTAAGESSSVPDRGRWVVSDDTGQTVVEAPSYLLTVSESGSVSIVASGTENVSAPGVESYLVRDGVRQPVTGVMDAKLGLDHVTLFVTFADGTTGRIEIGAATADTIAVSVTADDPSGVTSAGVDLEPGEIDGTYRLVGLPTLDP